MRKKRIGRSKNRLVFVTNIPSPYRLHEFQNIYELLSEIEIDFEILFMAKTERGRYWSSETDGYSFPHKFMRGISLYPYKDISVFINLEVVTNLLKKPPDWLLLGGAWYLPTTLLALLAAKIFLRKRTHVLFWYESPYGTYLSKSFFLRIKKAMLGLYHGFIVPGERAKEYITELFGPKRTVLLPNFVDERLYGDHVSAIRNNRIERYKKWNIDPEELNFLIAARLHEVKGILPFLETTKAFSKESYSILVAGDGPQRNEIEEWLERNRCKNVRILGNQRLEELLELYALCDMLILPSFSEPYGFVAVEALWAGIPLFLSSQVGATAEVLVPERNGFIFDPYNKEDLYSKFSAILSTGKQGLKAMGNESRIIAEARFASSSSARKFVDDLLYHFPPKEG